MEAEESTFLDVVSIKTVTANLYQLLTPGSLRNLRISCTAARDAVEESMSELQLDEGQLHLIAKDFDDRTPSRLRPRTLVLDLSWMPRITVVACATRSATTYMALMTLRDRGCFGEVNTLKLSRCPWLLTDRGPAETVPGFPKLTALDIHGLNEVESLSTGVLARLTMLTSLQLDGPVAVTEGTSINVLSCLTGLKSLSLSEIRAPRDVPRNEDDDSEPDGPMFHPGLVLDASTLAALTGLTSLRLVFSKGLGGPHLLGGIASSDEQAQALTQMTSLKSVTFWDYSNDTDFSERPWMPVVMRALPGWVRAWGPGLTELVLRFWDLQADASAAVLDHCPHLTKFHCNSWRPEEVVRQRGQPLVMARIQDLAVQRITPEQAAAVQLPSLQAAEMRVLVSGAGAAHLAALQATVERVLWAAETIEIEHTLFIENMMEDEEGEPDADRSLAAAATQVVGTLAGLPAVLQARGQNMPKVQLRRFSFSPAALQRLVEVLPGMHTLELRRCWFHDNAYLQLGRCSTLTNLATAKCGGMADAAAFGVFVASAPQGSKLGWTIEGPVDTSYVEVRRIWQLACAVAVDASTVVKVATVFAMDELLEDMDIGSEDGDAGEGGGAEEQGAGDEV